MPEYNGRHAPAWVIASIREKDSLIETLQRENAQLRGNVERPRIFVSRTMDRDIPVGEERDRVVFHLDGETEMEVHIDKTAKGKKFLTVANLGRSHLGALAIIPQSSNVARVFPARYDLEEV